MSREEAIRIGEDALASVRAWERDEIDLDTNLVLELEAALSDCLGELGRWDPKVSLSYECPECGAEVDIRKAAAL